MAKRLKTSRVRVWRLEAGKTPIHADYLAKIAVALETTIESLVA